MGKYSFSDIQDERREERRTKPIKKIITVSAKSLQLAKDGKLYTKMRKKYLEENAVCQCMRPNCTAIATQVHHKRGRGIWLLIINTWLAVCANCHQWIESHPEEAKEKGFSESRLKQK